jgi:glycosyltransferase involved in cell wall biosynthesis
MARPIDVSVVIPTRNRPEMLRRSVESALRQIGVALEVVVVIDGEDFGSEVLLKNFDDHRLRWVHLEHSVGGGEARNIGVRAANGHYVALLDDDDEWFPEKLRRQLALVRTARSGAYVVTTQYLYRRVGQPDEVWPGHLPAEGEELSEFLFSSAGGFQTSTYLCPRDLLLRVPFDSNLKRHQDWDWFLKLIQLRDFQLLVVGEPLSVYWVPEGRKSISSQIDWSYSLKWVESARERMTARAYASFVVRICLRGARMSGASAKALVSLLGRLLTCGGMTPMLVVHVMACLIISERMRSRIRSWKQRLVARERVLQAMGEL